MYDCTELVYDNSPHDWLAIKLLCNGQESCEFPYSGAGFRTSCDEGVIADYVHAFYNCLPRESNKYEHAFFQFVMRLFLTV